jgi:hypothetical protein
MFPCRSSLSGTATCSYSSRAQIDDEYEDEKGPGASLPFRLRFWLRHLGLVLRVVGDKIFAELSKGSGF